MMIVIGSIVLCLLFTIIVYMMSSVRGLVEMKKELGREKDMKDIELLKEYISRENQDGQMV